MEREKMEYKIKLWKGQNKKKGQEGKDKSHTDAPEMKRQDSNDISTAERRNSEDKEKEGNLKKKTQPGGPSA